MSLSHIGIDGYELTERDEPDGMGGQCSRGTCSIVRHVRHTIKHLCRKVVVVYVLKMRHTSGEQEGLGVWWVYQQKQTPSCLRRFKMTPSYPIVALMSTLDVDWYCMHCMCMHAM
jgi:hypothetical protein